MLVGRLPYFTESSQQGYRRETEKGTDGAERDIKNPKSCTLRGEEPEQTSAANINVNLLSLAGTPSLRIARLPFLF